MTGRIGFTRTHRFARGHDSFPERLFNTILGLSVVSWAALGIVNAGTDERFTPVRISIASLNLCVGILCLIREPTRTNSTSRAILASLPSLILAGFAFKQAAPLHRWPAGMEVVFVVGTVVALFTFVTLGRSFAILPAVRTIVTGGPFQFIRHPAYAGEFLMVLACGLSQSTLGAAWPALAIVPLIVVRVIAEESILKTDPDYKEYSQTVPWRMLPGVW